jgi:hypothetical protein
MGYYDHLRNNYSQLCADNDMNLNEFGVYPTCM